MKPCPACDVDHFDDPVFCLALGVALGDAAPDIHWVTEQMCGPHRTRWVLAMMRVSKTMQDLEVRDREAALHKSEEQGKGNG